VVFIPFQYQIPLSNNQSNYAGITTISIISKDIQGYKYMDIHGYPGQPAHEGY
jgi:hypothetical protein